MFKVLAAEPEFLDEVVANLALDALTKVELTLEQVGRETVDYLRSLTSEMRPPIGARTIRTKRRRRIGKEAEVGPLQAVPERMTLGSGGPRQAHPGHWADVSTVLAASYDSEVERTATGVTLVLRNTAEYAFWVEVRDGFFVLSGVTDPGGPVEQAFRTVAARLAPDMEIVVEDVQRTDTEGA